LLLKELLPPPYRRQQVRHDEYVREVLKFYPDSKGLKFRRALASTNAELIECGLGLAGEAGEVVDVLKKHVIHGQPLDKEALTKEMGDLYNYLSMLSYRTGISFETIREANVRKLAARRLSNPNHYVPFNTPSEEI
jgi:NTP pyrophosphatase (non-canonical NTP hydrolase)